jgi:hypothetical protein
MQTPAPDPNANFIIDLIKALTPLAWPLVVVFFGLRYKPEVQSVFQRLKRGKLLGAEVELGDQIDALEARAVKVVDAVKKELPASTITNLEPSRLFIQEEIVKEISKSPLTALLKLYNLIEKRLKILIASSGWLTTDISSLSLPVSIRKLENQKVLPSDLVSIATSFIHLRNKIVHSKESSEDEIVKAINLGLLILEGLNAFANEIHRVKTFPIALYTSESLTQELAGFKGVAIESHALNKIDKHFRVFATDKMDFREGQYVSWEWDHSKSLGLSYYRDPESQQAKRFDGSLMFIGRDISVLFDEG